METSGDTINRARPLIIGVVFGLIIGLIIGLTWAWNVQPVTYSGGAYPNEMSNAFQKMYVQAVAEAYMSTRDAGAAAERLSAFSVPEKVKLLAETNKAFSAAGRAADATLTGELAEALMKQEGWSPDAVSQGLIDTAAANDFAVRLGQIAGAPQPQTGVNPPASPVQPPAAGAGTTGSAPEKSSKFSFGRLLLIILFLLLAVGLIAVLISRLRKPRRRRAGVTPPPMDMPQYEAMPDAPEGMVQLRHWVDTYSLGNDNYEASFSVENDEGRFIGECGMGILDGFASGSPKKVLAFDVWLFDKTDIRTISVPVMSEFAFNDEVLRSKLPPLADPILAEEGKTFDLETQSLLVRARILELNYGDGPPDNSYFASLKVSLTAYLKSGSDVDVDMPIPEGYE